MYHLDQYIRSSLVCTLLKVTTEVPFLAVKVQWREGAEFKPGYKSQAALPGLVEFPWIHSCSCERRFDSHGVSNHRSRAQKVKRASDSYLFRKFLQCWVGLRACTPIYPLHSVWRDTLNPSTCLATLWCVNFHALFKVHFGFEWIEEESISGLEWEDVFNESLKLMWNLGVDLCPNPSLS